MMIDLARIKADRGEYAEASPIAVEAVELASQAWGESSGVARAAMHFAATILRGNGSFAESEAMFRRILQFDHQQDPVGEAVTLQELGFLKLITEDFEEAALLFEQVLEVQRAHHASPGRLFYILSGLGRARIGLQQFQAAEPVLLEAFQQGQSASDPTRSFESEAAAELVVLYTAWGRPEEAERWKRVTDREMTTPDAAP